MSALADILSAFAVGITLAVMAMALMISWEANR